MRFPGINLLHPHLSQHPAPCSLLSSALQHLTPCRARCSGRSRRMNERMHFAKVHVFRLRCPDMPPDINFSKLPPSFHDHQATLRGPPTERKHGGRDSRPRMHTVVSNSHCKLADWSSASWTQNPVPSGCLAGNHLRVRALASSLPGRRSKYPPSVSSRPCKRRARWERGEKLL